MTCREIADNVIGSIVSILNIDANLADLVNRFSYCKIKPRDNIAGCDIIPLPCDFNDNNNKVCSDVVKFVDRINFDILRWYFDEHTYMRDKYECLSPLSIPRKSSVYVDDTYSKLYRKMVNVYPGATVRGTAINVFDFIFKNDKMTHRENDIIYSLSYRLHKLIFVGDKCHLLAFIDRYGFVTIDLKKFNELKNNLSEVDFAVVVKRLFSYISKVCILLGNYSINQIYEDVVINPVILEIYKKKLLQQMDCKDEVFDLSGFTFNDDPETDNIIQDNIVNIIKNHVFQYLNHNFDFRSVNVSGIISDIHAKSVTVQSEKLQKAFKQGLTLFRIFERHGWKSYDPNVDGNMGVYLDSNHIYMYKHVNIIPDTAYLYKNNDVACRRLKDKALKELTENRVIYVDTIFINLTDGSMKAIAVHPNVHYSNNNVCMGDLKGKIVFTDVGSDVIEQNIEACECLLRTCNYTSAYTEPGLSYFKSDSTSTEEFGNTSDNTSECADSSDDIETSLVRADIEEEVAIDADSFQDDESEIDSLVSTDEENDNETA